LNVFFISRCVLKLSSLSLSKTFKVNLILLTKVWSIRDSSLKLTKQRKIGYLKMIQYSKNLDRDRRLNERPHQYAK
jgi:uncharacterized protein YhbP (UPF0306 family)